MVPLNDAYLDSFETDARFSSWYAHSDTPVPNMPAPARGATGAVSTNYRLSLAASNIVGVRRHFVLGARHEPY